jgi:cytochrome c-type biogenesis protein CcmH
MMTKKILSLCFAMALLLATQALTWAVQPNEILSDPALEARARALSAELRCLVCQNESIDESHADLARDLRLLIRERIVQGQSNAEIRAFLVSRYGDFILLNPPFKPTTWLLWLSPVMILLLGGWAIMQATGRRPIPPAPLTADEERQLEALQSTPPSSRQSGDV